MAEMLQVSLPGAGETVEYHFSPAVPVKFNFFVSEVLFSCDGNDLILTGEAGGAVVIKDYQTMANEGTLPELQLHGGETVPGDVYLFAFSGAGLDIETAAGAGEETEAGGLEFAPPDTIPDQQDVQDDGLTRDHSSLGAPITGEILAFDDVLPGHGGVALSGVSVFRFEGDPVAGSLADIHDPVADAIQHIIDSPDFC